jgi:hypothetical protein
MDYVHRRVLNIRFRLVEKCLRNITSNMEANTNERHYILYSIDNDVDSQTRNSIVNISPLMLDQIRKMKEEFALQSDEHIVTRDILSNLTEIWAPIKDLTEGRIHGYDKLSNREKELLSLRVMKIFAMLEDIYKEMK